jgi:hypothetical protein
MIGLATHVCEVDWARLLSCAVGQRMAVRVHETHAGKRKIARAGAFAGARFSPSVPAADR